jgi:hypothetical protein
MPKRIPIGSPFPQVVKHPRPDCSRNLNGIPIRMVAGFPLFCRLQRGWRIRFTRKIKIDTFHRQRKAHAEANPMWSKSFC